MQTHLLFLEVTTVCGVCLVMSQWESIKCLPFILILYIAICIKEQYDQSATISYNIKTTCLKLYSFPSPAKTA